MSDRDVDNPARVAEFAARDIVQQVIGSAGVVDQLPQDSADFAIRYGDGRTGVGEVKVAFDEAQQRLWGALLSLPQDQVLPLNTGDGRWVVEVRKHASFKSLKDRLPELLMYLRSRAIAEYDPIDMWPQDVLARFALAFGVRRVRRLEGGADECVVFVEGVGGMVPADANEASEWISGFLARDKHAASWDRLRRMDGDEKHAFVWVEADAPESLRLRMSFHPDIAPASEPVIPPWLTHVWLGLRMSFAEDRHVWLYRPSAGWAVERVS